MKPSMNLNYIVFKDFLNVIHAMSKLLGQPAILA